MSDFTPPVYVQTPDSEMEEVEVTGRITWDKVKGTVSLDLDAVYPANTSLCLVYSEEDEDFHTFVEMIEPID
jgi:hypothetical protein